jgi:translation initiation factor 3 subunit A
LSHYLPLDNGVPRSARAVEEARLLAREEAELERAQREWLLARQERVGHELATARAHQDRAAQLQQKAEAAAQLQREKDAAAAAEQARKQREKEEDAARAAAARAQAAEQRCIDAMARARAEAESEERVGVRGVRGACSP